MVLQKSGLIPEPLAGVGWLSTAANPRYKRRTSTHRHAEIEANIVESGSCRYLIDDRVQSLRRGDLLWLFPEQEHMIIDASEGMSLWVMLATPAFLAQRTQHVPARADEHPSFARPHRLREGDRLHLTAVAKALAACEGDPVHHGDGLAWWFDEAARLTAAQSGRSGRTMHRAIVKALALLESEPSMPLPALAAAVHMSASRLSHLFAEQVERSVSAQRNQIRLRRVQEQLQSGASVNLTQAAFDAGFGSYAQFARVLRQSTGISPRELLKSNPV